MAWKQETRWCIFVKRLFAEGFRGVLSCWLSVPPGRYEQTPSSGEHVVIIHLTSWVSCRCGGHDCVSCRLWGETSLCRESTPTSVMKSFLLCRYIKSVVLKVCHSLLVILVAVNFNTAPLFILVSLVRIKTKSRKTDIWSGKFKKKIKRFQAESTNIIPTKASSFSRTFNFLLPSLCGMETGCQVVYMMPSRKKAGIQSMSGFQLHRLAYAFRLSGICLSISRLKQTASCWLGCWLCPYVNFYNKHWSTFFHAVDSYVHPILKAVCPQNMMRTVIKGMVLFPILFDRIYEFLPLWCLMVWALLRGAHLFVCLYSFVCCIVLSATEKPMSSSSVD